jgi:hypothetical protein
MSVYFEFGRMRGVRNFDIHMAERQKMFSVYRTLTRNNQIKEDKTKHNQIKNRKKKREIKLIKKKKKTKKINCYIAVIGNIRPV